MKTILKIRRREYDAWLSLLGDLWMGKACTIPEMNGMRYMSIIRRWGER